MQITSEPINHDEKARWDRFCTSFDGRVEKRNSGCWEWMGNRHYLSCHYGVMSFHWKGTFFQYAHRFAWLRAFGSLDTEKCVCHHCDNPPCVNPSHLFIGTHKDNMNDAQAKGRFKISGLKNEQNPNARLTICQVIKIRSASETQKVIAKRFGVAQSTISRIKLGMLWKF